MTDQELLQAMSKMMKEELQPIKDDIAELKGSVEEIRESTNYISEWVERLEGSFKAHEIKTAQ